MCNKSFAASKSRYVPICLYCLLTAVMILFIKIHAAGIDSETRQIILEASGISQEDIDSASRKDEAALFDVYALAVGNTETMAIEGENSIQAQAKKRQAFGAFLPKLYLRGNKYLPENTGKYVNPSGRSSISLYARQPVFTGLDEWAGFKSAQAGIRIKKFDLYNKASQLLLDISYGFFNVLQIEKSLKNNEEILNLYTLTINELKRRAAIGRSRSSEVLRAESELYALEAQIKSLRDNLRQARLNLNIISGAAAGLKLKEAGIPDPLYRIDNAAAAARNRWDVKAADETLDLARSELYAAYGGYLPSLYIDGAYYLYQEKSSGSSGAKTRDYYFSLGAEIPLFTGGITAARVKEAESVRRQAELNLSKTIRLAEQDIADAYQRWESSAGETDAFNKALLSAEENYNTIKKEYGLNLVTILDVITSLKSLQTARNEYQTAELQHRLNRIQLGVAVSEFSGEKIKSLK